MKCGKKNLAWVSQCHRDMTCFSSARDEALTVPFTDAAGTISRRKGVCCFVETCIFIMVLFLMWGLVQMRTKENKGQNEHDLRGLDYFSFLIYFHLFSFPFLLINECHVAYYLDWRTRLESDWRTCLSTAFIRACDYIYPIQWGSMFSVVWAGAFVTALSHVKPSADRISFLCPPCPNVSDSRARTHINTHVCEGSMLY